MKTASEILAENTPYENLEFQTWVQQGIIKAMIQYATQVLECAAEKVNYPYRDEFGCHCDVPSIILNQIKELK